MERIATAAHIAPWLGPLLAAHVGQRLSAPVTFARWIQAPTGDIPVFRVPAAVAAAAREAGITIEVAYAPIGSAGLAGQ